MLVSLSALIGVHVVPMSVRPDLMPAIVPSTPEDRACVEAVRAGLWIACDCSALFASNPVLIEATFDPKACWTRQGARSDGATFKHRRFVFRGFTPFGMRGAEMSVEPGGDSMECHLGDAGS